jgi:hypothetical protein
MAGIRAGVTTLNCCFKAARMERDARKEVRLKADSTRRLLTPSRESYASKPAISFIML